MPADPIWKDIAGQSPIAAVLLVSMLMVYRLLRAHLRTFRELFKENIDARQHMREALEKKSQVIGENSACLNQVNTALKELSTQISHGRLKPNNLR